MDLIWIYVDLVRVFKGSRGPDLKSKILTAPQGLPGRCFLDRPGRPWGAVRIGGLEGLPAYGSLRDSSRTPPTSNLLIFLHRGWDLRPRGRHRLPQAATGRQTF